MNINDALRDFEDFWKRFFPEQATLAREEALKIAGEPQEGQLSSKTDEEMAAYQDKVAGIYGAYERPEFQIATMQHILRNLTFPKKHLVSLGAGPGSYELWLLARKMAGRITLIDHSLKMLERARDIGEALGIRTDVTLIAADVRYNKLPLASADAVFCINALHWSKHWERWIFESARLVEPKGEVFVSCSLFAPRSKISAANLQKTFKKRLIASAQGSLMPLQRIGGRAAVSSRYFICGKKR